MQGSLNFHRPFDRKCTLSLKQPPISRPKGNLSCFKAQQKKDKPRQKNGREIMGIWCKRLGIGSAVRSRRELTLERNIKVGCVFMYHSAHMFALQG